MWPARRIALSALALGLLAGCAAYPPPGRDYLVFFEEFSSAISPEAQAIIDTAAAEAKRRHTTAIRIEARGNATGSAEATMKISEARGIVVRDALVKDGIPAASIKLVPLGQMGTADTTVMSRRATITLEN